MSDFEYRTIYIAQKEYISSLADLLNHPNVPYVLEGICGFVIYEFYDEIFKFTHTFNHDIRGKALADPEMNQRGKVLGIERDKLLSPMHSSSEAFDKFGYKLQCIDLKIRILNVQKSYWKIYDLMKLGSSRINGIDVKHYRFPENIEVRIKLYRKIGKKTKNLYDSLLLEWQNWVKEHHASISLKGAIFQEKEVTLALNLGEIYEDYLAMLLVTLRHFRKELAIRNFSIDWDD